MSRTAFLASRFLRFLPASISGGAPRRHWRDVRRLEQADVAIVSFPKSGRTFVRVMLSRLYQRQFGLDERKVLDFASQRRGPKGMPRTHFSHAGDAMRRPHEVRVEGSLYDHLKVALQVRHPGDVVVSRYYHLRDRSHDPARQKLASQPLESFVWTEQGGVPSIVAFMNRWAEYLRGRGEDGLIVRYEDFLAQPEDTLAKLAAFIGLETSPEAIADAVEFGRFDNLKAREREGYFQSRRFGAGRSGDESSFKVRSGRSGGYRTNLSPENRDRVEAYLRDRLDPVFGYNG